MDKQNGRKEFVKLRMRLATDKIRAAKILLRNSEYRDAVSRAYYAMFYAAKAFLLFHGQDPSSHKGVDTLFHRFCYIHDQPKEDFARMFSLMRQARMDAEYQEKAQITENDARESIDIAQAFLKEIKRLLK
jgi:uncharacterized protein (UPF0332 family)